MTPRAGRGFFSKEPEKRPAIIAQPPPCCIIVSMMSEPETAAAPSYYEASVSRPPPSPSLRGEVRADVCVIGAGLTGISCALELARAGRKVALLESRVAGWGASGRNGGQALFGYSTGNLRGPARQAGVSERELFHLSLEALDLIRARVREFNIECDLRPGSLHAAVRPRHVRELREDVEKLNGEYNYPVRFLDMMETREIVASRRFIAALADDNSAHLHPLKYLLGLAEAAKQSGVDFYENTAAQSFSERGDGAVVSTSEGKVLCGQIVLACNAYLGELAQAPRRRIMPVGTFIGATKPLGDKGAALIANNAGVCDMNFVLDYFRMTPDLRLLYGGRVSYSNREPRDLRASIRARIEATFPQVAEEEIEYAWGGSVAITQSRFPNLSREGARVYCAQGFSGHGLALSGFAGKVIAEAICGDAEKFDIFAKVRHRAFPGGRALRAPLLVLGMLYYRLRDLL